ncbi:MAG: type II toxin-antitoxin system VapC family toxin [Gammaproteobacteria bacterium]|nr:type II toxin-antitoxin system VapC family toxin [Gammaproteobacteria bacterium]
MILADTSVWIDHLNRPDDRMTALVDAGQVLLHSLVIGEVALGNMANRRPRIAELRKLPKIEELDNDTVIAKIEEHELMGRGIGFVDAHLICSALERDGTRLWTHDRRLHEVADELGVAFVEGSGNGEEDA